MALVRYVLFLCLVIYVSAELREYRLAALEIKWDYAPTGINKLNGLNLDKDSHASVFTKQDRSSRIGKVYNKVVYRECVDDSCSKFKHHSDYLGLLGPIIRAEVGDTINVHFTNKANRKYSVHPHGVFYKKNSEGALYEDKTTGEDKEDDGVEPNKKYVYTWEVKPEHGPTTHDSDCLTWVYHSHVDPNKDVNTGLVGAMIICKKGVLKNGQNKNVDQQLVLMFTVMDENESWLLDKNIQEYCPDYKGGDDDFAESNKMHVINGYFYGNLPGLNMCVGDVVDWHMFGMGNEVDIHTAYFHGHTFTIDGHRQDIGSMFPAKSSTAHMIAKNPGQWLLNCIVNDHYSAGMSAYFNVSKCAGKEAATTSKLSGKTREYFIAAEEVLWDYAPSGKDLFNGGDLTDKDSKSYVFFANGSDSIGGKYWKALFVEYTDKSFTVKKQKDQHLGFLGPIIRAEVGDIIRVTFKNMASYNFSIQAHGVFYNKSNEGSLYEDGTILKDDDIVKPGHSFTYTWTIPNDVAPTTNDPDCLTYVYTSSVDPIKDVYSGLIGPLLICKSGTLDENGAQKNIKKEFVLMFSVTNENEAWYIEKNAKQFAGVGYTYDAETEGNIMHSMNGYLYANLPGLEACITDKVSWHLIGYGNEIDNHGVHFHGQTFLKFSQRKDSLHLVPGVFQTLIMTAANPGQWGVLCTTNDHYDSGMVSLFNVSNCGVSSGWQGNKFRTYYIAAEEIDWDYAPSGQNNINGGSLDDDKLARIFTKNSDNRIGRVYKKVVYKEYTDASFKTEKEKPEYFGLLGPLIKAEYEDTITVVFKNKASRDYSIHPHGVFTNKKNEGAIYKDGSGINKVVKPDAVHTYTWEVRDQNAPSETDNDCITWMYYSHVDFTRDTHSGLIGPLITCKKGTLQGLKTKGVDHEFPLFFGIFDENKSWYLKENLKRCKTSDCAGVSLEDEEFLKSNKMNGINGRVYGNLQGIAMTNNNTINWYLMTIGNELDMHNVHFHGQTVLARSSADHREDVIDLFPGVFETVKMKPDSVGRWLLHCHVNNHMIHGMEALYDVSDASSPKTQSTVNPVGHSNTVLPCNIVMSFILLCLAYIINS